MSDQAVNLDNPASYRQLDPDDMYRRVKQLAEQVRDAWGLAGQVNLPDSYRQVRNVVIAGMGGSAIGGSLLQAYGADRLPLPVEVWRNYGLPAYVGQDTLVIGMSYSGGTEETLSALQAAHDRDARMLLVSTGGKATQLAREWGISVMSFQYEAQPRATLGYLFTPLVRIFERLGFLDPQQEAFDETLQVLEKVDGEWDGTVPTSNNLAKQMASQSLNHGVVVYGADYLSAVARRWKTQMNENAKNWSFYEEFPELNHNAIVGYEYPKELGGQMEVIMLNGSDLPARIKLRMQVTQQLLDQYHVPWKAVDAVGHSRLAQMYSLISLGDFVTYYLALLNGADPTTIVPINTLKHALAKAP